MAAAAPVQLSQSTLNQISEQIGKPNYDRSAVSVGIVHLGVGGFHRAHQARYTEAVLASGCDGCLSWGICGVGIMASDSTMRDTMREQDRLYMLWERGPAQEELRVLGCHAEYLFAPEEHALVAARLAAPATKVVTLTVTEKGYCSNLATGSLDLSLEAVCRDVEELRQGSSRLMTAPGFLVDAALRRRESGAPPLAILSCDNVQSNGDKCARSVLELAEAAHGAELADYIRKNFSFPNSMVDRITPATTDSLKEELVAKSGLLDQWPVACEDFIQWIVEDRFPSGRPPWDNVLSGSCLFVEDVLPYELMKLRLLNGTHQAIGFVGLIAGYRSVHEAMLDETVFKFIEAYMDAVSLAVPPVPGVDLAAYKAKLRDRFTNQGIKDQLLRLTEDARNRISVACIPCLSKMTSSRPLGAVVACWIRYLADASDLLGQPFIHSKDISLAVLQPLASKCWADRSSRQEASIAEADAAAFLDTAFGKEAEELDSAGECLLALAGETAKQLTLLKEQGMSAMLASAA